MGRAQHHISIWQSYFYLFIWVKKYWFSTIGKSDVNGSASCAFETHPSTISSYRVCAVEGHRLAIGMGG